MTNDRGTALFVVVYSYRRLTECGLPFLFSRRGRCGIRGQTRKGLGRSFGRVDFATNRVENGHDACYTVVTGPAGHEGGPGGKELLRGWKRQRAQVCVFIRDVSLVDCEFRGSMKRPDMQRSCATLRVSKYSDIGQAHRDAARRWRRSRTSRLGNWPSSVRIPIFRHTCEFFSFFFRSHRDTKGD